MSAARLMGHLLLWAGFLCGAFVAVRRTEVSEDSWATIDWPLYGVCLAVAIAGVIQLHRTKSSATVADELHAGNVQEMAAALERLRSQLLHWKTEAGQLSVHEMHLQIDEQLSDDLAAFCDRRESLIDVFGLQQYAAIMTEFALAERTINRMWSASADGYVDEVNICHERAIAYLDTAIAQLERAKAA